MRLFIGLDLPLTLKNQIHDYLRPIHLSEKGWEKPHDYHQTLLFVGESTQVQLEEIKQRMAFLSFEPFSLRPCQFRFFNRRVMYLSFEESQELLLLRKRILECYPEWVRVGEKPFLPHVTVKRWQRYEYEHLERELRARPLSLDPFEVRSLELFESKKDAENNKYHVIHKISL